MLNKLDTFPTLCSLQYKWSSFFYIWTHWQHRQTTIPTIHTPTKRVGRRIPSLPNWPRTPLARTHCYSSQTTIVHVWSKQKHRNKIINWIWSEPNNALLSNAVVAAAANECLCACAIRTAAAFSSGSIKLILNWVALFCLCDATLTHTTHTPHWGKRKKNKHTKHIGNLWERVCLSDVSTSICDRAGAPSLLFGARRFGRSSHTSTHRYVCVWFLSGGVSVCVHFHRVTFHRTLSIIDSHLIIDLGGVLKVKQEGGCEGLAGGTFQPIAPGPIAVDEWI